MPREHNPYTQDKAEAVYGILNVLAGFDFYGGKARLLVDLLRKSLRDLSVSQESFELLTWRQDFMEYLDRHAQTLYGETAHNEAEKLKRVIF